MSIKNALFRQCVIFGFSIYTHFIRARRDCMVVVYLQLPMQSVPITTNVVSSNPAHGGVCALQHYVIKLVSDLWQVPGTPVSSTNKTDRHVIAEILLKVALNTIQQTNKNKRKQTKNKTKQNKKHEKTFLLVMYVHIVDIFIQYHK